MGTLPRLFVPGAPYYGVNNAFIYDRWTPDTTSEQRKTYLIDVSAYVQSAGNLQVSFEYSSGGCRLDIHRVELVEDGKVVASDEHHGITGAQNRDNIYAVTLKTFQPGSRYSIRYTAQTDGGTDSDGNIFLGAGP